MFAALAVVLNRFAVKIPPELMSGSSTIGFGTSIEYAIGSENEGGIKSCVFFGEDGALTLML